jgi:FtsH-binding integral membrane protein
MTNYESRPARYGLSAAGGVADAIDAGLRAHMIRVYNYMAIGLALTGAVAFLTFQLSVTDTATAYAIGDGRYLTGFGYALFVSPLKWLVILVPLAMVFFLSVRIGKMSLAAAHATFWVYAALLGASLATIFLVYTGTSITQVFFITAATFAAVSFWGYTTKRDLTAMSSFLFMGLVGIIIASIVNFFLASSALGFAISVIGVLIFTGLTAYDTQKIKEMFWPNDDGTVAGRKAIMGALSLYLDSINLFLMLLRLFGDRR